MWDPQTILSANLQVSISLLGGVSPAFSLAIFHLDAGERGKKLLGFPGVKSRPALLLNDGDRVGSLQAVFSPGHTPGHMAYLDVRDGSLIAGDAFTTQMGVIVAGVFKFYHVAP